MPLPALVQLLFELILLGQLALLMVHPVLDIVDLLPFLLNDLILSLADNHEFGIFLLVDFLLLLVELLYLLDDLLCFLVYSFYGYIVPFYLVDFPADTFHVFFFLEVALVLEDFAFVLQSGVQGYQGFYTVEDLHCFYLVVYRVKGYQFGVSVEVKGYLVSVEIRH